MDRHVVAGPAGPIEVKVVGDGPAVVLVPSMGRGADDFTDLAGRLAAAGHRAIAPEPRGIGGSTSPLDDLSLFDQAADTRAVIDELECGLATLVGHAYGNRVVRMTATEYPDVVESCVLLACGGMVEADPDDVAALRRVFDPELSTEDHLAAVAQAFFAPGNDPAVWHDGWYGVVAYFQGLASAGLDVGHWWGAGGSDVLVVQPADDVIAVPANADAVVEQLGERVSLVTIADAGHALLPEQPQAVADAVLGWLRSRGV